ncbi:MAG: divalent-cation tolerance protein CutA [Rhodospirillales bacterium]|nr:divalent-cation tolerance protein CutA [Rhodospirillales bacterium]
MNGNLMYVTAGSEEESKLIARTVVSERLAACANILGPVNSIYWWQGELCEEGEWAFILKTRDELLDPLTSRIKEIHSYDCPCVVALNVTGGNLDFMNWIVKETS